MQDSLLSLPNLLTFTKLVQTKSQNKQLCPDQHPGNHTETEVFTVFEVGIFFFGGGGSGMANLSCGGPGCLLGGSSQLVRS